MRHYRLFIFLVVIITFSACASTTTVNFLCKQDNIQIYVNDEYVGNGLVKYTAPKGVTTAEVECKRDGITIYSKSFYIKGQNNVLYDIIIPEYNSYSSDKQIHSK